MALLPDIIESQRLRLRPWLDGHIDGWVDGWSAIMLANRAYLSKWMVWALDEPSPPAVLRDRFTMFGDRFTTDQVWIYRLETRTAEHDLDTHPEPNFLGGIGVHVREGNGRVDWSTDRGVPETVELGYWLRQEATGRGFCTEATKAVIETLRTLGVARIEIRTHPENHPSRAVPQRLGCRLERVIPNAIEVPGGGRAPAEVWVVDGAASRTPDDRGPSATAAT